MSDGQSGFFTFCFGVSVLGGVFVSGALYGGTGAELSLSLCMFSLFGS